MGNKSNGVEELVISTTFRPMTVADALNLRNNDTSDVSKGIYFDEILTQQWTVTLQVWKGSHFGEL